MKVLVITISLVILSCSNGHKPKEELVKSDSVQIPQLKSISTSHQITNLRDTIINETKLVFTDLTKTKFDSMFALITNTDIPLRSSEKYVTSFKKCLIIKFKNGTTDTLCNKKDEETKYFETYTVKGLWNEKNHLLINFQDWEGGDDFLVDLNDGFKYHLNSSYQLSPNGDYLLGFNKFDITPIVGNTFTLTRVVKDSIKTFFDFDLGLVGIEDFSWKSSQQCLIAAGTISYEPKGIIIKEVRYYLMTIRFLN